MRSGEGAACPFTFLLPFRLELLPEVLLPVLPLDLLEVLPDLFELLCMSEWFGSLPFADFFCAVVCAASAGSKNIPAASTARIEPTTVVRWSEVRIAERRPTLCQLLLFRRNDAGKEHGHHTVVVAAAQDFENHVLPRLQLGNGFTVFVNRSDS